MSPRGERDDVAEALVVALDVVVLDEVVDDAAQMTLAEWDNVTEARTPTVPI